MPSLVAPMRACRLSEAREWTERLRRRGFSSCVASCLLTISAYAAPGRLFEAAWGDLNNCWVHRLSPPPFPLPPPPLVLFGLTQVFPSVSRWHGEKPDLRERLLWRRPLGGEGSGGALPLLKAGSVE